jgi:hypothetical protein
MTEAVACTCPSDAVAEYSANGAIRGERSVSKAGAPLILYTVWYLKERLLCMVLVVLSSDRSDGQHASTPRTAQHLPRCWG